MSVDADLAGFFSSMRGMLLGQTRASEVEAVCGPSPSGTARLQYYRTLVSNDHTGLLDRVYAFARGWVAPDVWSRLCHGFLAEHPPTHWEINRVGLGFPAWLAAHLDGLPPWLAEVAEYEWLELDVFLSAAPDLEPWREGPVALNPSLDVRQLAWDVPRWIADKRPEPGPAARPTVLIAWRDPRTLMCRFVEGTADVMFVVQAIHQGGDPVAVAQAHGLDPAVVGALMRDLGERGLLVVPV